MTHLVQTLTSVLKQMASFDWSPPHFKGLLLHHNFPANLSLSTRLPHSGLLLYNIQSLELPHTPNTHIPQCHKTQTASKSEEKKGCKRQGGENDTRKEEQERKKEKDGQ